MEVFKKRLPGVILLLILLASGFWFTYTVSNRNPVSASVSGQADLPGPPLGEGNRMPGDPSQKPGGRLPGPDSIRRAAPPSGSVRGGVSGTGYDLQIAAYAVVFLALSAAAYKLAVNRRLKIQPGRVKALIITLLCAGLFLRVCSAVLIAGHPFDINIFKGWAAAAADNLPQFYSGPRSSDYPPLYIYVLFLIGKISSFPAVSPYAALLLKLPSIAADMVTSLLLYRLARKRLSLEAGVLVFAFYIFNPAVIVNSAIWGQVDSFFTLMVVLSVIALSEKKTGLSAALFTAAVLMKPQGIIFLPVLLFALIREKSLRGILMAAVSALVTAAVVILPFSLHQDVFWIFRLFARTVGEYPYASVNAFNFFGLIGKNYAQAADTFFIFSYQGWGLIFIIMITAISWFIYIKGNSRSFAAAAALLLIAGVFTFSTSMHERYLFPAAALSILAFLYLRDKRLLFLSAGFSSTIYINTHFVLRETLSGINSVSFGPIPVLVSLLNVVLYICLVVVCYQITTRTADAKETAGEIVINPDQDSPGL